MKKKAPQPNIIDELDTALAAYMASDRYDDYQFPDKAWALRAVLVRLGASKCLSHDEFYPFNIFDKNYDQAALCTRKGCGHEYNRHFDWSCGYRSGCKYCDCGTFVPKET